MYALLSRKVIYPMYGLASGHRILPYLAQMEESQWWSPERLAAWQNARLVQLLRHAYDTVPYYRRVFDVAGLESGDGCTVDDLRHLALLTKSIIRDYQEELIGTAYPPRKRIANHTGGLAGTPLHFYQDRRQRSWSSANKLRCNRWAGWEFGKHTLRLWGHPRELKAAKRARGAKVYDRYGCRDVSVIAAECDEHHGMHVS